MRAAIVRSAVFCAVVAGTAWTLVGGTSLALAAPEPAMNDAEVKAPAVDPPCVFQARGAVELQARCGVKQTYEAQLRDSGTRSLTLIERTAVPPLPKIRIALEPSGTVSPGVQPASSFVVIALFERGSEKWFAKALPHPGSMGSASVTITSARAVRVAGVDGMELHGFIDAQLVPTHEGTARGTIELHAEF